MSIVETNWKHKLSNLALASTVHFQERALEENKKGEQLFRGATIDDIKETLINISYQPLITRRSFDCTDKCEHFTGRDLVAYLIKANHLGEVKSFYLNFESTKDYKPYSLVTVPKSQVRRSYRIICFKINY